MEISLEVEEFCLQLLLLLMLLLISFHLFTVCSVCVFKERIASQEEGMLKISIYILLPLQRDCLLYVL